jgi:very-short-patch-repair endonuclease
VLHGLPTLAVPDQPEFTDPEAITLGHRERTHVFGAMLPPASRTTWFGVRVTTVAWTLVDLARHDADDAIMAADAALCEGLVTPSQIDAELAAASGWPGVRRAREVVALATPLAESPIESLVRLRLHDDGFPPATPQTWIAGYRADLYIEDVNLVVEADGRIKYAADERENDERWREKRREHAIRTAGAEVERVIWADLWGRNWVRASDRLRSYAPSRRRWSRLRPES